MFLFIMLKTQDLRSLAVHTSVMDTVYQLVAAVLRVIVHSLQPGCFVSGFSSGS